MSTIFTSVTPATTYGTTARADISRNNRAAGMLFLDYEKGDSTSLELKLEYSSKYDVVDSETWYQETEFSNANPAVASFKERQFNATGKYKVEIPGSYSEDKIRISFKRTGGSDNGLVEVTTVTTVADVAGSLNNKYFFLNEPNGGAGHYVWFNVNAAGVNPGPFGSRVGVEIALATGALDTEVATAIQVAVNPLTAYNATVLTTVASITNAVAGLVTNATAENSGFTIGFTQQGTIASSISVDYQI